MGTKGKPIPIYRRRTTAPGKNVTQVTALSCIIANTTYDRSDLLKKWRGNDKGIETEDGEFWYFEFIKTDKAPTDYTSTPLHLTEQSDTGLHAMIAEMFAHAGKTIQRLQNNPITEEYQQAITFFLDEYSPYHRYIDLSREQAEAILERILAGEKIIERADTRGL